VLTTHYLEEAQELCDQIAIINRGEVAACEPTDVKLSAMDFEGGLTGGGISGLVTVSARPRHRCTVQGWPATTLRDAKGDEIAVGNRHEPFTLPYAITVHDDVTATAMSQLRGNTTADQIATLDVSMPGWASPVSLPYRGEQPRNIDAGKGAYLLTWSFVPPNGDDLSDTGLRGLIMNTRYLPTEVSAGSTLAYELDVMAVSDDVRLDPCIGYRESLIDGMTNEVLASEDHVLNCNGVGTIAPYTTVRFAMELHVPASLRPGMHVVLRWQAVTGQGDDYGYPDMTVD